MVHRVQGVYMKALEDALLEADSRRGQQRMLTRSKWSTCTHFTSAASGEHVCFSRRRGHSQSQSLKD